MAVRKRDSAAPGGGQRGVFNQWQAGWTPVGTSTPTRMSSAGLTQAIQGHNAGGGGGGFASYGQGGPMRTVETLHPQQAGILGAGGDLIQQLLRGKTPSGYHPFAPMSPSQAIQNYDQFFRPAAEAKFQQEVMPQIAESHVGPGTYWGGARAEAEGQARGDFENAQMANIGQMFQQDRQRAMGLLPFGLGLAGLNTGVTYGEQGQAGTPPWARGLGDILRGLLPKGDQGPMGGGGFGQMDLEPDLPFPQMPNMMDEIGQFGVDPFAQTGQGGSLWEGLPNLNALAGMPASAPQGWTLPKRKVRPGFPMDPKTERRSTFGESVRGMLPGVFGGF